MLIRKNELLLIAGVLLAAALLFVFTGPGSSGLVREGACLQVTVGGELRLLLPGGVPDRREIVGEAGERNVVEVLREGARMAQANCPDQWCVRKGIVPCGADVIVCLPHRLIVRWVASDGSPDGLPEEYNEVDVVLQ